MASIQFDKQKIEAQVAFRVSATSGEPKWLVPIDPNEITLGGAESYTFIANTVTVFLEHHPSDGWNWVKANVRGRAMYADVRGSGPETLTFERNQPIKGNVPGWLIRTVREAQVTVLGTLRRVEANRGEGQIRR